MALLPALFELRLAVADAKLSLDNFSWPEGANINLGDEAIEAIE